MKSVANNLLVMFAAVALVGYGVNVNACRLFRGGIKHVSADIPSFRACKEGHDPLESPLLLVVPAHSPF